MKTVTNPCKICGQPAFVQVEDDTPPELIAKFRDMLTHDACLNPQPENVVKMPVSWLERTSGE